MVAGAAHWIALSVDVSGKYQVATDYENYGGTVIKSSDYGQTWVTVTPPGGQFWCSSAIAQGKLF